MAGERAAYWHDVNARVYLCEDQRVSPTDSGARERWAKTPTSFLVLHNCALLFQAANTETGDNS